MDTTTPDPRIPAPSLSDRYAHMLANAADSALTSVEALLATEGLAFTRDGRTLSAPGSWVVITWDAAGWRVSWICDAVDEGAAVVDLPVDARFGAVADVAAALYARAVR